MLKIQQDGEAYSCEHVMGGRKCRKIDENF